MVKNVYKFTTEHRRKLSEAHKGKKYKPMSEQGKKNMGEARKGKYHTEESKRKMSKAAGGREFSSVHRKRLSEARKGDKNPSWKGGITPTNQLIRTSLEYKLWRESVFKRDNYTCIWCGARNGNGKTVVLNADHIKPFALYPELRFAIDNGRTLCIPCHKTTDTYGWKVRRIQM